MKERQYFHPSGVDNRSDALKVFLSLSHIVDTCRRSFLFILVLSFLCASATAFYTLTRPIRYDVSATFHDDNAEKGGMKLPFGGLGFKPKGLGGGGTRTQTLMRSRKILDPLIRKLHLQARVKPLARNPIEKLKTFAKNRMQRVRDNWNTEVAYMSEFYDPPVPDKEPDIWCEDIVYNGEYKRDFAIVFVGDRRYELRRMDGAVLGTGHVDEPLSARGITLTIRAHDARAVQRGVAYGLTLYPMAAVVNQLAGKVRIAVDNDNEEILHLQLSAGDRLLAARVLNEIMQGYIEFLQQETRDQAQEQLSFLQGRQDRLVNEMEQGLQSKASVLGAKGEVEGLMNYESQIKWMKVREEKVQKELMMLDTQIAALDGYQDKGHALLPNHIRAMPSVGPLLATIRSLEKKQDTLKAELKTFKIPEEPEPVPVPESSLLAQYRANPVANLQPSLFDHGRGFLLSPQPLMEEPSVRSDSVESDEEEVVKGLDIHTATQLYTTYTRKLDEMQKRVAEYRLAHKKLSDENFAVSSLSGQLGDRVGEGIIQKASDLAAKVRDRVYFAHKERKRHERQLDEQRESLKKHVSQKIFLLDKGRLDYEKKIRNLLKRMVSLIDQEVEVLQGQIDETVNSHRVTMLHERDVLNKRLTDVRKPLQRLPNQWAQEQEWQMQQQMHVQRVQSVARMIEAVSLGQSNATKAKTIDEALAPVLPLRPKLSARTFFGAAWGAALAIAFLICMGILRGFRATAHNLRLAGCDVGGCLTECRKPKGKIDATTLRKILSHFQDNSAGSHTILVNTGGHRNYLNDLAKILEMKGDRVLVIDTPIAGRKELARNDGLYAYLRERCEQPTIEKRSGWDSIPFGGESEYLSDLLSSRRFTELLSDLEKDYDWILVGHHGELAGIDSECIVPGFDRVLVTVGQEKYQDLQMYINYQNASEENQVLYVFAHR